MKKTIMWLGFTVLGFSAFCQEKTVQLNLRDEYLQKSRNQKTAAWILLGGGALATTAGMINFSNEFDIWSSNSGAGGAIVATIGVGAMVGSIPLFMASSRNRNKAMMMNAGIKIENGAILQQQGLTRVNFPAVSLGIRLK
jgi:hypothetical protein